ncbi:MAG: GDP-mannose 4,6-dehydratase [candidate division Zixibacteria bacterium]
MKPPSAFITGIAGFAGSFLAEELLEAGWKVSGGLYKNEPLLNIRDIRREITLCSLDISSPGRCRGVITRYKPDYIFHLAAMASVGQSFQKERQTFDVNFGGTLNMLEAARSHRRLTKFVLVSSADCYGIFTPRDKTLAEDQPLRPVSPYGIAKAAAEHSGNYYYIRHGVPVTIARSFNHSGPRQSDNFVVPSFARQIARIEAGRQRPVISVGDLSAKRDISDVRDIVRGYRLIAEKGKEGEAYQLCSGKAWAIERILDQLVSMSEKSIKIAVDPARLRKVDIPCLRGNQSKAYKQVGFRTRYSIQETLKDTLDYWRANAT